MNLFNLAGKVAVVTGGNGGIGLGMAEGIASLGANIVIAGRDAGKATTALAALRALDVKAEFVSADVTKKAECVALIAKAESLFGRVDILVNNAGIGGPPACLLHELAPADWEAIFNTNLRGVYYMMRAVLPLMIAAGTGHVVNISSLAGKNPLPRGAAYSASKWALNGLSYGVAEELRSQNIRVSVICPGSVDTDFSPRRHGKDTQKMLQPEDVAHAVAMLVTQKPQSFISEVLIRPTEKP
jgi:NAD(P)-dependent dehydrogenase (short-subunit alcohol dehydrogenase family)